MKTLCPLLRPVCRAILILTTLFLASEAKASPEFPDPPDAETGKLTVKLSPSGIDSGWHFVGEKVWRDSDTQVVGLALGDREIEFRPVSGYIQPAPKTVSLISGNANLSLSREYFKTTGGATGRLKVILQPDEVAAGSLPGKKRAQWRLLGDGDNKWRDSGDSRDLPPGVYLIECKPVDGKTTPRPVTVTVSGNDSPKAIGTYYVKDAEAGAQPEALDFSTINDPNLPYAYVGQIRTNNSLGTGCVVLSNAVVTAAHLIFDEDNLKHFEGLQWLFQRDQGTHEPIPQIPRLTGILTSYAAQRALDDSPGKSSARSRSCDVAALNFKTPPGRNGYSDYQFSNATANELLTSANLKTMACYPLEGISAANRARMHATTPADVIFTASPDFSDSTPNDTYTTTDITSVGGAAGAPVFVRNDGGVYEWVGIYLGGSATTVVRALTEDVDTLIFWANTNGEAPNGGVTQIDGPGSGSDFTPGAIKVNIKPSGTGRWKLLPSNTARASGSTVSGLPPGTYTVEFTNAVGFVKPSPASVVVSAAALTTIKGKYTPIGPVARITTQENNAIVSRNGFHVRGTASDPNGIRKYQVKITGKAEEIVLPGRDYFTGEVAQGRITIQMRAQNRAGDWGEFTSIAVEAK